MDQRISIEDIFKHPWMNKDLPTKSLKLSFNKLITFSKFSKVYFFKK